MAQIELYDIDSVGSELFQDNENYFNEFNEPEIDPAWKVSKVALTFTFSHYFTFCKDMDREEGSGGAGEQVSRGQFAIRPCSGAGSQFAIKNLLPAACSLLPVLQ